MSLALPLPLDVLAARRRRAFVVASGFFILLCLFVLLGIGLGSSWIAPDRVLSVLFGGGDRTERLIILQLRLPRVAIALLSGGAIAIAGFILQKVTRNSLASPGVLGVVDGAALGVVIFLALLSDESNSLTVPIFWQPLAAFIGAGLAIAAVFILCGRQASSATRLLLFGIAVAALCKALTMILMLVGPIYRTTQATRWLAGAVNEVNWGEIETTAGLLVPALLLVALIVRKLPPTDLDAVSAQGVGLDLDRFRILAFALAAMLTAIAVAFVGAVGFIGLMAPHMARLLVGRPVVAGIVVSFLIGACMLIGADIVVRALFAPTEVPAGTVTAVLGTPYFLYLLMRRENSNG
jgi:iron complex transport system permease protein